MGRIANSPMPWLYPVRVRSLADDDIFVFWQTLSKEEYAKMLERFKRENGIKNDHDPNRKH